MPTRSLLAAALAALLSLIPAAGVAERDPEAVAVAERSMAAMGGRDAFDSVQLLRFDFVVERDGEEMVRFSHWWDRLDGRYRLEGMKRESGLPLRVLMDLASKEGEAWVGDRQLEGEELRAELESGYARFMNDSYWLLMPWKWLDPGVHLNFEGERRLEGEVFDVVRLSFDSGVGLTSGDRYWGFVSRDTDRMEVWEYVLQQEDGSTGESEPTRWRWTEWEEVGAGLTLSKRRSRQGAGPQVSIRFPILEARTGLDRASLDKTFSPDDPAPSADPETSGAPGTANGDG